MIVVSTPPYAGVSRIRFDGSGAAASIRDGSKADTRSMEEEGARGARAYGVLS